ncbi:alpha/beta hydrolase [Herbiconiux sp. VKM Ac-2851]|uniref:alpha/beta hydrolase n=1 Tax=Herbiconiux sp. VKM Ac-2851 TaxID=2739025 RepID=UPI001563179C|nr:alpha/beta hydrolase [Herbiconiux sp. VKM Ac-2851]NQX37063.1 alpha/beta hydrolase [Herbiconiux sp. VKM Ac-2851]
MARVIIVPGLAVRRYADAAVAELRCRGHRVDLLRPASWRGTPVDVRAYGELLAHDLIERRERVDVLVGLSIGTEAAAVAASNSSSVARLLLVSPTVDPIRRTWPPLLRAWFFGSEGPNGPGLRNHVPDWARAGVIRVLRGMRGAMRLHLEEELQHVHVPATIVHTGHDPLTTREWARQLAAGAGARFIPLDDQPHSWPYGDPTGFADLIEEMCRES